MTNEAQSAGQKPATVMPSSIHATNPTIQALMTNKKMPSVTTAKGSVNNMTKKRIASQNHATFQGICRGACDASATGGHPLDDHIEDVLYVVLISISI